MGTSALQNDFFNSDSLCRICFFRDRCPGRPPVVAGPLRSGSLRRTCWSNWDGFSEEVEHLDEVVLVRPEHALACRYVAYCAFRSGDHVKALDYAKTDRRLGGLDGVRRLAARLLPGSAVGCPS